MANITIEQAKARITRASDALPEAVFGELAKRVVERTPVAQEGELAGRTRAHWRAGVGGPDSTINEETDTGGSTTVSRAVGAAKRAVLGTRLFLTNALPWIGRLEHGNATQDPHGMVKLTRAEYRPIAEAAARKIKQTVR